MNPDRLPKIEKLLKQGWDLTVTTTERGLFHATAHLGRRHGPDSHHSIGASASEAIVRLEQYIDTPEDSAVRRSGGQP